MSIQVKCFDEEHEKDLEELINQFLMTLSNDSLVDIKYGISHFNETTSQIYSYSAMVIYKAKKGS